VVTQVRGSNGPTTGGAILSLSGINFGPGDRSPTISIGATQCDISDWRSATSMMYRQPAGGGKPAIYGQIGALLGSFTYDGALAGPRTADYRISSVATNIVHAPIS
jgi:hypothetical protein